MLLGVLLVGSLNEGILVPPGEAAFKQEGWCAGECLDNDILATEDQKINLFAGFLHSHLAGREMAARHFRCALLLTHFEIFVATCQISIVHECAFSWQTNTALFVKEETLWIVAS